ncbi:YggT family protein [Nocardia sp. NPDC050712]|uniref:YggT family protein n=1 Tax=Nocardia sp. NPDC050712 TaxID=3155518 RepID=UPI0033CF9425
MAFLGTLLGFVTTVFIVLLIARMVLDWVMILADRPQWAEKPRQLVTTLTEPVLAPVRKIIPPIRFGGTGIDLAFTVVFILALILRTFFYSWG